MCWFDLAEPANFPKNRGAHLNRGVLDGDDASEVAGIETTMMILTRERNRIQNLSSAIAAKVRHCASLSVSHCPGSGIIVVAGDVELRVKVVDGLKKQSFLGFLCLNVFGSFWFKYILGFRLKYFWAYKFRMVQQNNI